MSPFDDPATLERFARLAVGFAANVQPGQLLQVKSEIGKEAVTRAVAAEAYRAGAKYVDVEYFDLHVKRARLEHAAEETLDWVPEWLGAKLLALSDARAARIALSGPAAPRLLEGIDPARSGKDQLPALKETGPVVNARTTNWTILPCPTRPWAAEVHPGLTPDAAWERLGEQIVHVCRLDEDDPVAAWRERAAVLVDSAARLTSRRFDAIRFRGEGTDLRVGLLPTSKWLAAQFETVDGIAHMPNLPSEEVFSSPDPERVDGIVRARTIPSTRSGSGELKTSSLGRFGMWAIPSTVSNCAASHFEVGSNPTRRSVPSPRKRIASKRRDVSRAALSTSTAARSRQAATGSSSSRRQTCTICSPRRSQAASGVRPGCTSAAQGRVGHGRIVQLVVRALTTGPVSLSAGS